MSKYTQRKKKTASRKHYHVYWEHSSAQDSWEKRVYSNKIRLCAIDPGVDNYAIGIIDFFADQSFQTFYLDRWRLSEEMEISAPPEAIYAHLSNRLRAILDQLQLCNFILIERQLPESYDASHIMRHTLAFLASNLRDTPLLPFIMDLIPHLKGKVFEAPKHISKKGLKEWAKTKAYEICYAQGDAYACNVIWQDIQDGKGDDVGDVVLMMAAFFIKNNLIKLISNEVETSSFSISCPSTSSANNFSSIKIID